MKRTSNGIAIMYAGQLNYPILSVHFHAMEWFFGVFHSLFVCKALGIPHTKPKYILFCNLNTFLFLVLQQRTICRSVPLKSHLSTYTEKGKIPVLDFLSAALESAEYERALARGLVRTYFIDIPYISKYIH